MSYLPEIVLPENHEDKYKVDLVHITDDEQEHRLTLAQYTSWGEAEWHLNELETAIETEGLDAIANDIDRLQEQIHNPLLHTFGDDHQPLNVDGDIIPHHIDGGGTVHWFDRVESRTSEQSPYELRYFRAHKMESGDIRRDSYPVMPLAEDDPNLAWPAHGLDMYLEQGNVFMAQQFAKDVADAYDQPFPEPIDIPTLNPEPEYYFGYGIGPNSLPSLEAVKTWVHGSERQFDTLTVSEYGTFDEAAVDERELEQIVEDDGLEAAMHLAELWAVAGGYLDDDRDDGRLFFEEDAPKDPFLTERERELALPNYSVGAVSANGQSFLDVMKTWGEDNYERLVIPQPDWDTAFELYQVTDDLLQSYDFGGAMNKIENAGVEAGVIDLEREDGRLFTQGPPDLFRTIRETQLTTSELDTEEMPAVQIVSDFDIDDADSSDRDTEWLDDINRKRETNAALEGAAWFEATFDNWQLLEPIDDTVNYAVSVEQFDPWTLELSVEKVWRREDNFIGLESLTIQAYDIEDGREQADADKEALLQVYEERGLQGMMHQVELQAMKNGELSTDQPNNVLFRNGPPDRFETLAQQLEGETNPYWNTEGEGIEESQIVQNPYWRMETLRVNDPDGEQIGHALHMVVYPNIEQPVETVGAPNIPDDEPFQMLEMAHFETIEDADKFSKEFRGYLVPGLLDGPELAEEVARLEEHPVEWKTLDGQDLNDYHNLAYTLTHNVDSWKLYNPHAERDAQIRAEGQEIDAVSVSDIEL